MEETQDTQVTTDSDRYQVLRNGAIYDHAVKKIVKGAALTSVDASALRKKRTELRREVIRAAANEKVDSGDLKERFGDWAYLAEIAGAAQVKARNSADPKMIEAARWLQENTGELESADSASESALGELRGVLHEIAELARLVNSADSQGSRGVGSGSVVDVVGSDVK